MGKFHDELGREICDPTPLEVPAYLKRPESTTELIKRIVQGSLSRAAERQGFESFDDANDFDMDEDDDAPVTVHEYKAMSCEVPDEAKRVFEDWRAKNRRGKSEPALGKEGGDARAPVEGAPAESEE